MKVLVSHNVQSGKVMSATDAAYIAGFIDGEGTLTLTKDSRKGNRAGYRYQPLFSICNTSREVLESIRESCGNGRLTAVYNTENPNHKPGYVLRFSSNQMRHLIPQLRPFLRLKAEQADLVLDYLSTARPGANRTPEMLARDEAIRQRLRALNRKGRPVDEQTPVPPQAVAGIH